jgi:hypothetical protein
MTHPEHRPVYPVSAGPGTAARRELARRWTNCLLSLAAVFLFAFVGVPSMQRLEPVREVRRAIDRANIDATALFYSECASSGQAESAVRARIRYAVSGPQGRADK